MRKAITIGILSLLAIAAFYITACRSNNVGERVRAPDFTLPDLDGNEVSLSDFKGKVIFLHFWATWCPPCRNEMPSVEVLYQKLKDKDFELLAVSLDRQGSSAVEPFIRDYGLTFPILLDLDGKVARTYKVRGIPSTFIVDKEGLIAERVVGARDWTASDSIKKFLSLIEKD